MSCEVALHESLQLAHAMLEGLLLLQERLAGRIEGGALGIELAFDARGFFKEDRGDLLGVVVLALELFFTVPGEFLQLASLLVAGGAQLLQGGLIGG